MGTINVSLPSDGSTADVSDYNTPINTIVNEFNGNIENANIKTGAAIATAKLATDAGITTGMLANGSVTSAKLDFGGSGAGIWWEEIGRTTLGSAGDTITVSSLPARKYLKILIACRDTGGAIQIRGTFNNDSGSNYNYRFALNGAADSTGTSTTFWLGSQSLAQPIYSIVDVINISDQEKIMYILNVGRGTAGAANTTNKLEATCKWANTSDQITRVDIANGGAGDFAIGSEVIILGHN